MELIFTKHAKDMMILRGISQEKVREAIKMGAKVKQTDGFLSIYSYIRIAFKIRGEKYIIKTVMVD